MKLIRTLSIISPIAALAACSPTGSEDYDTPGYDTSDPYGVPSAGGYESAPYQEVNPPASDPSYGSAAYEETTSALPSAPPSIPATASTHTVVKGDTLWGLSRQYGVSVDALRLANSMASGDNNIRLGQSINIPAQ